MNNRLKLALMLPLILIGQGVLAQDVEMADTMRSEGKIYVVVGIILLILVGLFIYLGLLDRKVKKLETRVAEKLPGNR